LFGGIEENQRNFTESGQFYGRDLNPESLENKEEDYLLKFNV
jgi:hypothetical protein